MDLRNGFDIKRYIRTIPDYPRPGIMFRDITTLLANLHAFRAAVDELVWPFLKCRHQLCGGHRGPRLHSRRRRRPRLGAGICSNSQEGQAPARVIGQEYSLEYGVDTIEIHADAIKPGDRVLLDRRSRRHRRHRHRRHRSHPQIGGNIIAAAFVIDLPDLGGAEKLRDKGVKVHTLVSFEGH